MPEIIDKEIDLEKRLRYFTGQFLQQEDFQHEQAYLIDRQRRQIRQLLTPGIAEGLEVEGAVGDPSVTITPGVAVDGQGRLIILIKTARSPALSGFTNPEPTPLLLLISYREEDSDKAVVGKQEETRIWERPRISLIAEREAANYPADEYIRLARLMVANGALVAPPNQPGPPPPGQPHEVRARVGVNVGDSLQIRQLILKPEGVPEPIARFSTGPDARVFLNRPLHVDGDLTVGRESAFPEIFPAHFRVTGSAIVDAYMRVGTPRPIEPIDRPDRPVIPAIDRPDLPDIGTPRDPLQPARLLDALDVIGNANIHGSLTVREALHATLAAGSVGPEQLRPGAVGPEHVRPGAVGSEQLIDQSVTLTKITLAPAQRSDTVELKPEEPLELLAFEAPYMRLLGPRPELIPPEDLVILVSAHSPTVGADFSWQTKGRTVANSNPRLPPISQRIVTFINHGREPIMISYTLFVLHGSRPNMDG